MTVQKPSKMFGNDFGTHKGVECGLCTIIKKEEWVTEIHPIPLVSVDVVASVVHAVSQVEVTQVFINKEEQPIEAIYYFPIDSNGAVTHFEAEIEGRKIKGIAKAHEEAKEEYEKAIESHQTAFLGEENKPDIFKVKIGFLKPGSQAKIVLGYVSEVKNEKDSSAIRFFIPTTVAPRYVPKRLDDEKSEDLKKMQFSESSPAPITIKVNVSIQGEIKTIESPTHKITVSSQGPIPTKENWTKAAIELSGKTTDMDRDFVLLITPTDTHKPRLYLEKLETSLAVMAHLIPSFKLDEQNAELIFVLDRSGSMQGQSIDLAKKALTLFLHSLPADCYFNIVGFGSTYKFLFPKSVKYDDDSLKKAVAHAKELYADMGGTEILEPLKEIFSAESVPGYLRQIFVITDGEVGNTEEVIGITKAKAHESRVFTLGIGDGASHHLVEGIAQAGGGTSAFVTYNEAVDKKVLQQLKDALQPSLTNVQIKWEGVTPLSQKAPATVPINKEKTLMGYGKPVETETVEKSSAVLNDAAPVKKSYLQAPEKVPPIFDGSQLVILGVFDNPEEKPTGAVITADSPDGPLSVQLELSDANDVGQTGMIHKLAAIKVVREIELKVAALGFDRYNVEGDNERKKQEAVYKAEIIEIAVKQGIASKYTSFVAVDTSVDNKTPDNWAMQTRLVPSQLAHGWHGASVCSAQPQMLMRCSAPVTCFGGPIVCDNSDTSCEDYNRSGVDVMLHDALPEKMELCSDDTSEPKDVLHEIISFQSFDGSFKWEDALIQSLGVVINTVKQDAEKNGWDLNAWATALAVTFFSEKLVDQKDSWELVVNKATKWLKKSFPSLVDAMVALAKHHIKST
ncbi:unnamed protein product [Allacma fusca]|uniref:Uncharacterized protein n=1 Tax=Allacma fusca TaxID=39272 RepID=A0A8J2JK71_9HEXA|nr:unnamed protein product [Allacma fusca]